MQFCMLANENYGRVLVKKNKSQQTQMYIPYIIKTTLLMSLFQCELSGNPRPMKVFILQSVRFITRSKDNITPSRKCYDWPRKIAFRQERRTIDIMLCREGTHYY